MAQIKDSAYQELKVEKEAGKDIVDLVDVVEPEKQRPRPKPMADFKTPIITEEADEFNRRQKARDIG